MTKDRDENESLDPDNAVRLSHDPILGSSLSYDCSSPQSYDDSAPLLLCDERSDSAPSLECATDGLDGPLIPAVVTNFIMAAAFILLFVYMVYVFVTVNDNPNRGLFQRWGEVNGSGNQKQPGPTSK